MPEFNASLLREKFTIHDNLPGAADSREPVIALSNRLVVPLLDEKGQLQEIFVVRAQNMHLCVRLAAEIVREFVDNGPLVPRLPEIGWDAAYRSILKGYEGVWNHNHWAAIYNRGNLVFHDGAVGHHLFLDVIEQCDARNRQGYEKSLEIAQDAFRQRGRLVTISHDSNVAMLLHITGGDGKCGLIVRTPNRTTTFNMAAKTAPQAPVNPAQFLGAAAAFLEAIQLAFMIGTTKQKVALELFGAASPEALQASKGNQRLKTLRQTIDEFEDTVTVTYRPERPDFGAMIDDAADYTRRVLSG